METKRLFKAVFVDDEIWALRGIQGILEWKDYGFEIAGAYTDPKEALAAIEEIRPDIVFTDVRMPEIDGIELIEIVKKEVPSASFVIVSAYRDFEIARQACKNEVSDYLIKPLDKNEVKTTLTALYDKLLKKNEGSFRITDLDLNDPASFKNAGLGRFIYELTSEAPLRVLTASKEASALFKCLSPVHIGGIMYSYIIASPTSVPAPEELPDDLRIGLSTEFSAAEELAQKVSEAVRSYRGGFIFSDNDQTARIEEFLYDNLDKKITMDDICRRFYLSKPYIFELFRENSDTTAMGFLKTVRLNRAADLLRSADSSVSDVASAVGFDDAGYFAKTFKAKFGLTPEQYAARRK